MPIEELLKEIIIHTMKFEKKNFDEIFD